MIELSPDKGILSRRSPDGSRYSGAIAANSEKRTVNPSADRNHPEPHRTEPATITELYTETKTAIAVGLVVSWYANSNHR